MAYSSLFRPPGSYHMVCSVFSFVYNVSPDMSWFNKDKQSNAANNV